MTECPSVQWREEARHTWVRYVDEATGVEHSVLQDSKNDRAWLDSSYTMPVTP